MPSLILDIAVSSDLYLAVYQGRANRILLRSRDGRKVSLPAARLQPYLTDAGIHGSFELEFSSDGKLLRLSRLTGG
ncbi:DUF2835 domain-containing protein [Pseudomonas fluvialis]|uniref:DUF2835 domain-containing protein n=1 Tax=Pseudomonas fluvialis TaxID=1793966 RepID=UPI00370BBB83